MGDLKVLEVYRYRGDMKLWVVILVARIWRFLSKMTIAKVLGGHCVVAAGGKVTIRGLIVTSSRVRPVDVGVRWA